MQDKTELRIQQDCYMWFHNHYPQYRGAFFRIRNESTSGKQGAIGKSTGIVKGVADSALMLPNGTTAYIEFKTETGIQSQNQKDWERLCSRLCQHYYIIRSLEQFQSLCRTLLD